MALLQDLDIAFYVFHSHSGNSLGIAYLYIVEKLNAIYISRIPNKHFFESANCFDQFPKYHL